MTSIQKNNRAHKVRVLAHIRSAFFPRHTRTATAMSSDLSPEEWALLDVHYKIARKVLLDTIKIVGKKHVVAVAETSESCDDDDYPCNHYGEVYLVYDNGTMHLLDDCDSVTIGVLAAYFTPHAHRRDHHFIGYADYFSYDGIPPYQWTDRIPNAMHVHEIISKAEAIIGKAKDVLEGRGVPKNRRKMKDKQKKKKKKRARSRSRERSVDVPVAPYESNSESS